MDHTASVTKYATPQEVSSGLKYQIIRICNITRTLILKQIDVKPDYKLLRFLAALQLDVYILFPLFFFLFNPIRILRYLRIRLMGHKPKVVLVSAEGDGRFRRVLQIAEQTEEKLFIFELPIFAFAHSEMIFEPWFQEYKKSPDRWRWTKYSNVYDRYYHAGNIENRKDYAKFCTRVIRILNFFLHPAMLVNASCDDTYCVELFPVAQKFGIKWMVVEREGTQTHRAAKSAAAMFQKYCPCPADYIMTANDIHHKMFRGAAVPDTKVEMLGELRADRWHNAKYPFAHPQYREWSKYKRKLLFLTFGERNYIEPMFHPHVEGSWLTLLHDIERVVGEFAQKNPDTLVFYKMGHTEDFHAQFLEECEKRGIKNVIPLRREFPCEELIAYSDVIIGFQSTATIEAMYSKSPILYPFWAFPPEVDPEFDVLPLHHCKSLKVMRSPEELAGALQQWKEGNLTVSADEIQERRNTINEYFNNPDGKLAEKFLDRVMEIVGTPN